MADKEYVKSEPSGKIYQNIFSKIIFLFVIVGVAGAITITYFLTNEDGKEPFSFYINFPKQIKVVPEELTALSLYEKIPISKSGGFSLESSNLDNTRMTIFIKDQENNQILIGYVFPRKDTPTSLTQKQKNAIDPYLYPNTDSIVIDTKSTALALSMLSPELIGTSEDEKVIFAANLLAKEEFPILVQKIEQALIENPKDYLQLESEVYIEISKSLRV